MYSQSSIYLEAVESFFFFFEHKKNIYPRNYSLAPRACAPRGITKKERSRLQTQTLFVLFPPATWAFALKPILSECTRSFNTTCSAVAEFSYVTS